MTRPKKILRIAALAAALLTCLWLAGCVPLVQVEQPRMTTFIPLEEGKSIGQTFTGRYDGLSGIAVFLRPSERGDGTLRMQLWNSPLDGKPIEQVELPLRQVDQRGFYRFNLPMLDQSNGKDYYATIEVIGEGGLRAGIAPVDSYTGGAAYRNGAPADAQLTFRLVYDPARLRSGLATEVLNWLKLLVVAAFLYLLPGWGLLSLLYHGWGERRWPEKIGLAAGVSLALYPLLYLWTSLVGLHPGALYAWLPPVLAAIYLMVKSILRWRQERAQPGKDGSTRFGSRRNQAKQYLWKYGLVDLAYVALILIIIAGRFWSVRTLDLPMWGDSYHHSLVTQLLLDNGSLFNSWAPYAEMRTFTYHFGFHTLSATLSYLSGLGAASATLWAGQIVNALAVFCLIPLAVRMGRNPWAGVAAILLAGMLAPMPMSYTNWGRYTQLAGQVILGSMIFFAWETLDRKNFDWRIAVLTGITLGGLALTHLRVVILAVLFLAAYLLVSVRGGRMRSLLVRCLAIGAIAGVLFLPWFIHTYSGQIMAIFNSQITTPASQVVRSTDQVSGVGNVEEYLPAAIWLFLPVIIGWGFWRRERSILLISVWCWLAWIVGEPGWYGLPGTGAVTTFAILIAAYIPAALFYGAATGWVVQAWEDRTRVAVTDRSSEGVSPRFILISGSLAVVAIAAGVLAFSVRQQDIQIDQHAMALRPDLRAAEWIRENTPTDTRFLVNADLAFSDSTTVGTDGGWWLPLTAGRQITIPPMNYSFEEEPWPGYRDWINDLYLMIDELGIDHPQVVGALRKRGVTHVYIGQQQGSVSHFGTHTFNLDALQSSPYYKPVYNQDRVWIFEVLPQ